MYYYCPCCGYPGIEGPPYKELTHLGLVRGFSPPYRHHFGWASYDVCPCCGFEYGNDDEPRLEVAGESFEEYLEDFVARGCKWLQPRKMPPQWTLEEQLLGLPVKTPATHKCAMKKGGMSRNSSATRLPA